MVLLFNLLFRRWLEAIYRAFHYVNLSKMCRKQALHCIIFLTVSVRIYISFDGSAQPSKV